MDTDRYEWAAGCPDKLRHLRALATAVDHQADPARI
jgi:hypothetical protein